MCIREGKSTDGEIVRRKQTLPASRCFGVHSFGGDGGGGKGRVNTPACDTQCRHVKKNCRGNTRTCSYIFACRGSAAHCTAMRVRADRSIGNSFLHACACCCVHSYRLRKLMRTNPPLLIRALHTCRILARVLLAAPHVPWVWAGAHIVCTCAWGGELMGAALPSSSWRPRCGPFRGHCRELGPFNRTA